MGICRESAYLTYFKGAESKKNGTQAKLRFLPSNLHIKIAQKWLNLAQSLDHFPLVFFFYK